MSGKPACLSASFRILETVAAVSGLLMNVTLALLIRYRTNKELKTYSRVLLCSCLVDSLFAVNTYFIEMVGSWSHYLPI